MNEKIYCRIRRVRAVLLTFFLTAAVVLTDAQSIREKEYEKTEIIYCIGDSITYGSGLEDEERLTKSYPAQLGVRLGPRYLIFNYGVRGATLPGSFPGKLPQHGVSERDRGAVPGCGDYYAGNQ